MSPSCTFFLFYIIPYNGGGELGLEPHVLNVRLQALADRCHGPGISPPNVVGGCWERELDDQNDHFR